MPRNPSNCNKPFKIERKIQSNGLHIVLLYVCSRFRDRVMFFPHNIDFRGRCYPLSPHFNHMGADLARSLLVFAEGRPLGPRGLDWLKLHCINLTGLKKRNSVEERMAYAEQVLPDILDSAADPFGGRRWWMGSDEPWQTLGVCMEIGAAIESGDPARFVSRLPIHQDGSCNGLQHYAALGRDVLGAGAVNLLPADRPQDIYSEIVDIVERKRRADAEGDSEDAALAQLLEGFVMRKVVKQTVMTTVYGVTLYGAKLQIARQLKDLDDFPVEHVNTGAKYLAEKTLESLNDLFKGSQAIQAWLTQGSKVLSKQMMQCVEWRTPLGLKVLQPYLKHKIKRQAFIHSFIHSLFATYAYVQWDIKLYFQK